MTSYSSRTAKKHISKIRKEKFSLRSDGRYKENPLSSDLHRAINELSVGLNSEDIHFILELIQNAEDNHYSDGVEPKLEFIILDEDPTNSLGTDGALLVVNNELGFQTKHVEALCAIGKTTKDRTEFEGYIGEKGIGFKSVFKVTNCPSIFSNGYRFYFDRQEDPLAKLGYIIPYWIDYLPQPVRKYQRSTCILLPLLQGKTQDVISRLAEISPLTILFLSKLKGLKIIEPDKSPLSIRRNDSNYPEIELFTNQFKAKFWIGKKKISLSHIQEPKREGIISRTITVAFQLDETEADQNVFVYLPTKLNSGLPFIINADFLTTADRESILVDSLWNQCLRDGISTAFIDAFEGLLGNNQYRLNAYRFIPLSNQFQNEFFQPVTEKICEALSTRPIVISFDENRMVPPSQSRLAPNQFRELLKDNFLPQTLKENPLVHADLEHYPDQLQAIGVRSINSSEILDCLSNEDWLDGKSVEWFITLYFYLKNQEWENNNVLRKLNIIPLQGGGRSNSYSTSIFIPSSTGQRILERHGRLVSGKGIAFLDPALFKKIKDDSELLAWLQKELGIKELTLGSYCLELAQFVARNKNDIETSTIFEFTRFICDRYDDIEDGPQKSISGALPIILTDGSSWTPYSNQTRTLVFPENMDPLVGWQHVFPDFQDRVHLAVISRKYIEDFPKISRNKWRRFFRAFGATEFPPPPT